MTLHMLIDELTEELKLTPEQQFRLTAKIKRHVHDEKSGLCHRLWLYSRGAGIYETDPNDPEKSIKVGEEPPRDPWISGILKEKHEGHAVWATLPDEKIVTWSIGTHVYKQKG